MKKLNLGGLFWILLGIAICIQSIYLKTGNLRKPGPGFMPFLSGAFLGLLGLILTLTSISKKLKEDKEGKSQRVWAKGNWSNIFFTLIALFGYLLLLKPLGFILTTFIFLFFLFKLKEPKRWVMPLIFSVCTVVFSYLIFSVWLKCQFPKGILGL